MHNFGGGGGGGHAHRDQAKINRRKNKTTTKKKKAAVFVRNSNATENKYRTRLSEKGRYRNQDTGRTLE